jgi:formylglycine-generating enzyme
MPPPPTATTIFRTSDQTDKEKTIMRRIITTFTALLLFCGLPQARAIDISLVPVGDAGNVADPLTGYGAVPYTYYMGKYDVTTGEYAAFLNGVATKSDPYGLYNPKMLGGTAGIIQTSTSSGFTYTAKGAGDMPIF